jgi:hypothetical protein
MSYSAFTMALFTAQLAAQAGKVSGQRRRERAEARKQARHNPQLTIVQNAVQTAYDPFVSSSLTRTREVLKKLYKRLEATEDPKEIELLSRAISALSKNEFALAGRPLPGSLRPSSKPDKRLSSTQASFDSPLLPADNQLSTPPTPKPQVYDGPENG